MIRQPYLLKDFMQSEKKSKMDIKLHSPQCPKCFNVDGRLILKHDNKNSTIEIIKTFITCGFLVNCLCCDTSFRWCTGNFDNGIVNIEHEIENDVIVPIEYFSKILEVDISKYIK